MKNVIVLLLIVAMCGVAQAVTLEEIIFGPGPQKAKRNLKAIKLPGIEDPISLVLGMQTGPAIDNQENEIMANFAMRYRMLEIGPILHAWPGDDDMDSCWGIYALRHLSDENLVIGKPFVGFHTTFSSKSDGMYGFMAGFDRQIDDNFYLRSTIMYRDFRDAMAQTHADENDEFVASLGPVFLF